MLQCTVMLLFTIKKLLLFSLKLAWEGGVNEYKPTKGLELSTENAIAPHAYCLSLCRSLSLSDTGQ